MLPRVESLTIYPIFLKVAFTTQWGMLGGTEGLTKLHSIHTYNLRLLHRQQTVGDTDNFQKKKGGGGHEEWQWEVGWEGE